MQIAATLDAAAFGRAEVAFQEEFDKWRGLIDTAAGDFGQSQHQRAAAVAALRIRQHVAATAVRRRVIEAERQKAKAARCMHRAYGVGANVVYAGCRRHHWLTAVRACDS